MIVNSLARSQLGTAGKAIDPLTLEFECENETD